MYLLMGTIRYKRKGWNMGTIKSWESVQSQAHVEWYNLDGRRYTTSILTGGKEEKVSMDVGRVAGGKLICSEMHGIDLWYEVLGNWGRFDVVMIEKEDQVD